MHVAADAAVELVHLADHENSVVIRVLGPCDPSGIDAEVVITSTFCNGRLSLCLAPRDLDDWAKALDDLAVGRSVCWMTDMRNLEINVEFNTEFSVPLITVEDVQGSGTAMAVPVDLPDGWVQEQRERLERVRQLPSTEWVGVASPRHGQFRPG
ncbi:MULTISPECIES: DUF5959 family protein [unclassified Streptomyces]|uniref:DUF5959 family protein n=1 Tax=unclassified Streptomyces TaxID=2593676 RepID=UPI0033EAB550